MAQPNWNTPAGSLGTYPSSLTIVPIQLSASAVLPAVSVTYAIISGSLPAGLEMTEDGLINGTPNAVAQNTSSTFVVRTTDNYQNIRDRTFSLTITGVSGPTFSTPSGTLFSQNDSIWVEYPIEYNNPIPTNQVIIRLIQGRLPPGLEINEFGLIRGYPAPPTTNINLPLINTAAVATSANVITCFSTIGFVVGRPIIFSGASFGGIVSGATYYVKEIFPDGTTFTVSNVSGGSEAVFSDDVGYMTVALPNVTQGQPTIQTYSFTLELESILGTDRETYSITIANQQAPASIGGDNKPLNTRVPTILNTRPATYNISQNSVDYSYYSLPPDSDGFTYPTTQPAFIGRFDSDNEFTFKIMGHDFDNNELQYVFADLPLGLIGDSSTGWVRGLPIITDNTINQYSFSVAAQKVTNPALSTPFVNFSFIIKNDIEGIIGWVTPSNLGTVSNGIVSTLKVQAISDVELKYRLTEFSGPLPPNLTLLDNGEISGVVAYQPTDTFLPPNATVDFTFSVEAYSDKFPVVSSVGTFTVTVDIQFGQPTDTLYIKCTPSVEDRNLLNSLLENTEIIPEEYLYRPTDPYFGKSQNVVYEHAYGIYASDFDDYVAAVTRNHYWRQLTLGEIKTAVARNEAGEIIYEVVYSEVIDNLVNPEGVSINKTIIWPRRIPLNLGPWYTSSTSIYTSYSSVGTTPSPLLTQSLIPLQTQDDIPLVAQGGGISTFYTSLTPGEARILYPNSLQDMREQVGEVLGQEFNSNLLPLWMTSQQRNGSTTGFVPAWVICYTKPGLSEIVKNNIETMWTDVIGNPYRLNVINFKIDRFTVDKSTTFNYDNNLSPPAWTSLPSGSPTPVPLDSKNFYILFPRQTILPDETQY